MESASDRPRLLKIRKYPNRRFYDATRSCHVTLGALYELVSQGFDVEVTDSATGEDLTHVVLTQMILEHDAPKLAIFPAAVLHQIIRTQQQFLGGVVERFFRQTAEAQRAAQQQWSQFLESTLGAGAPMHPMAWAQQMWNAGGLRGAPSETSESPSPVAAADSESGRSAEPSSSRGGADPLTSARGGENFAPGGDDALEPLKAEIERLARRLAELERGRE